MQVTISKSTGRITGVSRNGNPITLTNGPRIVSGTSALTGITHSVSDSNQVVTATYSGNLNSVTYTMRGDGWMRIDYTLNLTGNQSNIGVTFDYPEERIESMRWFGGGPEPVWKNRLAGVMPGVWEKTANNPIPGQTYTTDPIFRGYHRDLRWAVLKTTEARIQIVPETANLFLRVLTPANGVNPRTAQFTMPPGDVSLLHGISPIGTKFFAAGDLGPMSAPNVGQGTYSGSFWLSFADVEPRISRVNIVTPFRILVDFNQPMSAAVLDPASYDIPGLIVHGVESGTGNSVLLDIQPLEPEVSYTLDVASLLSANGGLLAGERQFELLYQSRIELDLSFDSLSGGTSPDVSGNNRHATVSSATLASAWRSQGLQLNGATTSHATVSLPAMSAFTVEAWVKLANAGPSTFPRLVSMANENVQVFFDYTGSGTIGLNVRGYGDWRSEVGVLPAFNTWFHVAIAYDSTTSGPSIYLNGQPLGIGSAASSSGSFGTGGTAVVGNRASDGLRGLNGIVDEFRIHSRALGVAEIAESAAIPPTQSFGSWTAARGYPGATPGDDADGNGEPELLDYVSDTPAGETTKSFGVLHLANGQSVFHFRIGKAVEKVLCRVDVTTDLWSGLWAVIPENNFLPWRDLGMAIEYLALPIDTNESKCFGRLLVMPE